jgi:hypothetical protein
MFSHGGAKVEPVPGSDAGPSLVDRLCAGEQPVRIDLGTTRSSDSLRSQCASGSVHLLFPNTRGGTRLRVTLNPSCKAPGSNPGVKADGLRLEGSVVLDMVTLRCVARIDLETLDGVAEVSRITEACSRENGDA